VLVDVSTRSVETTIFGRRLGTPIIVAPTALAGLVWDDGEVALARAAAEADVPFCVSTQSIAPIERIAGSGARLWQQLYVWKDRQLTWQFLNRAKAAGAEALLLTVDTAVSLKREYNVRNGFGVPFTPSLTLMLDVLRHPRWMWSVLLPQLRREGMPSYAHYPPEYRTRIGREAVAEGLRLDERLSWDDVRELRRRWTGPLLLKGIARVEDAERAVAYGCDGIVVSNHGARNLDSAVATADTLGPIADRVGGKCTVLVDSGIRRGSDVAKALALGAKAVLVGRAPLYGTAVGGQAGARHVLDLLSDELGRTMALLGCRTIGEINRSILAGGGPPPTA
jgi:(S)-mandelate dehydrogenase